jgi:hypothetical protein
MHEVPAIRKSQARDNESGLDIWKNRNLDVWQLKWGLYPRTTVTPATNKVAKKVHEVSLIQHIISVSVMN